MGTPPGAQPSAQPDRVATPQTARVLWRLFSHSSTKPARRRPQPGRPRGSNGGDKEMRRSEPLAAPWPRHSRTPPVIRMKGGLGRPGGGPSFHLRAHQTMEHFPLSRLLPGQGSRPGQGWDRRSSGGRLTDKEPRVMIKNSGINPVFDSLRVESPPGQENRRRKDSGQQYRGISTTISRRPLSERK